MRRLFSALSTGGLSERKPMPTDWEWATLWDSLTFNRCKARCRRTNYIYHGQCELKRGHDSSHALERGMEVVTF